MPIGVAHICQLSMYHQGALATDMSVQHSPLHCSTAHARPTTLRNLPRLCRTPLNPDLFLLGLSATCLICVSCELFTLQSMLCAVAPPKAGKSVMLGA